MRGIELFHYDPWVPVLPGRVGRWLPFRRRLSNFGDLLGPIVVRGLLARLGVALPVDAAHPADPSSPRLFSIGSVLHFAKDGDVIWGSGCNGKVPEELHAFTRLDVRAVRGPLTRNFLLSRGIDCPAVFGDPGLLLPLVMPSLLLEAARPPEFALTLVPNYNDMNWVPKSDALLDPRSPLHACLHRIARSRLVVASSLHAVIVAESLGIPARLIRSRAESEFKYRDYYLGTGRTTFRVADTLQEAQRLGGERPATLHLGPLLDSFPQDLWS